MPVVIAPQVNIQQAPAPQPAPIQVIYIERLVERPLCIPVDRPLLIPQPVPIPILCATMGTAPGPPHVQGPTQGPAAVEGQTSPALPPCPVNEPSQPDPLDVDDEPLRLGWPYPAPMEQDPGSRKRPADDIADSDQDAVSQDGSQSMPPAKRIITTGEWPQEWHNEWALYWSQPELHRRRQVWDRWPKEFKTCAIRRAGGYKREELQKWQTEDLAASARANAAELRAAAEQAVSGNGAPAPAAPPPERLPPPDAPEPVSHDQAEGARIGEASQPGPNTQALRSCPDLVSGWVPAVSPSTLPFQPRPPPHDLSQDGDVHPNPGPRGGNRVPQPPLRPRSPSPIYRLPPQQPSGSHAPARGRKQAEVPARQRDARAAPQAHPTPSEGALAKGIYPGPNPSGDRTGNRPGGNASRNASAAMMNPFMSRGETVHRNPRGPQGGPGRRGRPRRPPPRRSSRSPTPHPPSEQWHTVPGDRYDGLMRQLEALASTVADLRKELVALRSKPRPAPPGPPPIPDDNPWNPLRRAAAQQAPTSSIGQVPPSRTTPPQPGGGGGGGGDGRGGQRGKGEGARQRPPPAGQRPWRGRYVPRSERGPACLPGGSSEQGKPPGIGASQRSPPSRSGRAPAPMPGVPPGLPNQSGAQGPAALPRGRRRRRQPNPSGKGGAHAGDSGHPTTEDPSSAASRQYPPRAMPDLCPTPCTASGPGLSK